MGRIPLFKVYMNKQAGDAAKQVINSGYIGQGEVVSQFEKNLQAWFAHPHIVTLNTGTSALHLALHMLKELGTKVLTSPLTCTATNWPILANGLDIEWVDVDPKTLNMDLDDLARKITKDTKIILLTHWGGNPVDLHKVNDVLKRSYSKYGFAPKIIEDCAHSFGTKFADQYLGTHGNICMYSL
jgi:dTDP-4-amino-4,6-dideoxygalactose transaminase